LLENANEYIKKELKRELIESANLAIEIKDDWDVIQKLGKYNSIMRSKVEEVKEHLIYLYQAMGIEKA
jgi:hypothetical protein